MKKVISLLLTVVMVFALCACGQQGAEGNDPAAELPEFKLGIPMETWQDNGITPSRLPENLGGIVSVNWFYHIPGASLTDFLTTYRKALRPGGYLALDMVTRHYDRVPGNQWHSDDQKLPEGQRRPSEYTVRLDRAEMECLACRCGFALVRSTCFVLSRPQRAAYLLRRVD